jgi:hypothetical protein
VATRPPVATPVNYGVVNLRLRRREIELQLDPKYLSKLFLLENRFEHRDIKLRKLADIILQPRLRDWDRDVISKVLLHWVDYDRPSWVRLGRPDTDAFGLYVPMFLPA